MALGKFGEYVIIDGMSGTGKETQVNLLIPWLDERGYDLDSVVEPHNVNVKRLLKTYRNYGISNPYLEIGIFSLDRKILLEERINPSMQRGNTVITVRGFTSTMAVQARGDVSMQFIKDANAFMPVPSLILVLDAPAELAYQRVNERFGGTWEGEKGIWERKIEEMGRIRNNYLQLGKYLDNVEVVDATPDKQTVQEEIRKKWVNRFESK